MGFLSYQLPGSKPYFARGEWQNISMQHLPESCFFMSDFQGEQVFFFKEEERLDALDDYPLFFNADTKVFEVEPKAYLNGLQFFINEFESENVEKAVYSRIKLVERRNTDNISDILKRLKEKYQAETLVYLASDEKFGTWMGATPEILVKGDTTALHTMALAGTKQDVNESWTPKEYEEHQFVVDFIEKQLLSVAAKNVNIGKRTTVKAGKVYHLKTDFNFQLATQKWQKLLEQLHPTPAVCGTPRAAAKNIILKHEPHERAFYTGMIGLKNDSKIAVYVNLRCMQILEHNYALYLGGGITKSSNIVKEFQETEDKSETLLSAIDE